MGGFISTYVLEDLLDLNVDFNMNQKYKCIAICGNKGHGKSTAGKYIQERCRNKNIFITAFAEPLKKGCKYFFDLSDEQLEEKKEELDTRWNVTPRDIFIKFGTELMRENVKKDYLPKLQISQGNSIHIQENFWVALWLMKWNKNKISNNDCVVITDLRFPNEYDLLKKEFGESLLVIRVKRIDMKDEEVHKHSSETSNQLIKEDFIIENDMSDSFYEKLKKTLE
jgi:hypothetical protein